MGDSPGINFIIAEDEILLVDPGCCGKQMTGNSNRRKKYK